MNNLIKILTSRTSWLAFLIGFLFTFLMVASAHAQTPEETAKKYNVSFPIAELGNCASVSECRIYCEDPINQQSCTEFAQKKGFSRQPSSAFKMSLIRAAASELGCENEDACKQFCSQEQNWEKCGAFAKKYRISGGHVEDPAKEEILVKAKEVLGCDSLDTCKGFCEVDENKEKCDEFAKVIGLRGGVEPKGPGGCTSLESCKEFCSDPENFQICSGFVSSKGVEFKGPGGCNSEDSCKAYCQENQDECSKFLKINSTQTPSARIQEKCLKTPSCSWKNDRCECVKGPKAASAFQNANDKAKFCREFPEKCKNAVEQKYDPAKQCKEKGCSWSGNSCQCADKIEPLKSTKLTIEGNIGTGSSVLGIEEARSLLENLLDFISQ